MAIDIKSLFDRYNVKWRDRGKNVSHGNIVISCPFCNKTSNPDHSEHLAINTTTSEYFCYRNPNHKGQNLVRLFKLLNIPAKEYAGIEFKEFQREYIPDSKDYSEFAFFDSAEESQEVIDYLYSRNFSQPVEICRRFKLKYTPMGKWAGRLLIPLTIGWTGRAMRSHIEPRYLTHGSDDSFFFYKQGSSSCVVLEGAIDAMRVATVSSQFDVAAKCRGGVSPALLYHLRQSNYLSIYNAPDGTVPFLQVSEETRLLRSYCRGAEVKKLGMPENFKDFGMMLEDHAREWLYSHAR